MPGPVTRADGMVCLGWTERDLVMANTDNGPPLPEGARKAIKSYVNAGNQASWLAGRVRVTTCGQLVLTGAAPIKQPPINCLECMST